MPSRPIYFSNENDVWIMSQTKGNISQIVNGIIEKERLEKSVLTPRMLLRIQNFINSRAVTGAKLFPRTVLEEALNQFLGGSLVNIQSNTGYEEAEKSYA